MRLHLITSPTKEIVPFNYQPKLTGSLHKWIGKNYIHNQISLYSFSWLQNGKASNEGVTFNDGARFFISTIDKDLLKTIVEGIQRDPDVCFGLCVKEIIIQEDPVFYNEHIFQYASPILIKRRVENRDIHYSYKDEESNFLMTETLKNKFKKAGKNEQSIAVSFDINYHNPKTKLIHYNKIGNKVNMCPIKITGTPEQLAFAWNVGVGNSTGIGFGALK